MNTFFKKWRNSFKLCIHCFKTPSTQVSGACLEVFISPLDQLFSSLFSDYPDSKFSKRSSYS